jgi:regulatory protein YycI of two-component signal transduction system YycFG
MEIVGADTVDGVTMCKAVMETNTADEIAKMEYLWSEDGETFKWTYYDADGKVVSFISMKDGKMTMTDEEGNVVEFGGMI